MLALVAFVGCVPDDETLDVADQAITHGTLDDGDPAVVGLVAAEGEIFCTGTLIAPRVVVTAAHCLIATTVTAVVVGRDRASGWELPVVHAVVHPRFDSSRLTDDLGVVVLAEAAPVAAVSMWTAPLDASLAGRSVRVIGFGRTSPADGTPPRKRHGTATVATFTEAVIELRASPSLTCEGDSGGPALASVGEEEVLLAVTSAGDRDCAEFTRSTRVDTHLAWLRELVAWTAAGAAAPGQRCLYPEHCSSGRCFAPADAPRIGYCAPPCEDDGACPGGMFCAPDLGECRYPVPSPGALGGPCDSYADCDSRLCAHSLPDATGICSVGCAPEVDSCPETFECGPDAVQPALNACFPPAASSGCSASSNGATPPLAAGALVALIGLLRRRRTRPGVSSGPARAASTSSSRRRAGSRSPGIRAT